MINKLFFVSIITLLFNISSFTQDFTYIFNDDINKRYEYCDIYELGNDDILLSYTYRIRSKIGFYDFFPYIAILSSNGELKSEISLLENGYSISNIPYIIERDNELYCFYINSPIYDSTLTTYDPNVFNGKLKFQKLNFNLEIVTSYEYPIMLDSTCRYEIIKSVASVFSANYEEEDNLITLGILKTACHDYINNSQDTLFFLKLNLDGEILLKNYHELYYFNNEICRNGLIKNATEYILFCNEISHFPNFGDKEYVLMHFNHNFDFLREDFYNFRSPENMWHLADLYNYSAKQIDQQTSLVGGTFTYFSDHKQENEFLLARVNNYNSQPIDTVIIGSRGEYDHSPFARSIDFCDTTAFFSCVNLNRDIFGDAPITLPTYIVISKHDNKLNKIIEYYYHYDNTFLWINAIRATKDGGCLVGGYIKTYPSRHYQGIVLKFPQEAFTGLDYAHQHGLSLVTVYPNPGRSKLTVRTTLSSPKIEIYDSSGKLVYKKDNLTSTITEISTESWGRGYYLYKVSSKEGIIEEGKWIKN